MAGLRRLGRGGGGGGPARFSVGGEGGLGYVGKNLKRMNERRVAVADVINYSIFKCLFTEMNNGLGLMVINSQHFPVLF